MRCASACFSLSKPPGLRRPRGARRRTGKRQRCPARAAVARRIRRRGASQSSYQASRSRRAAQRRRLRGIGIDAEQEARAPRLVLRQFDDAAADHDVALLQRIAATACASVDAACRPGEAEAEQQRAGDAPSVVAPQPQREPDREQQLPAAATAAIAGSSRQPPTPASSATAIAIPNGRRPCRVHASSYTSSGAQLPELAFVQFQHAVQPARQAAVVGHQHQAGALRAVELEHQLEHGRRGLLVEVAGGLVAEHAGRLC